MAYGQLLPCTNTPPTTTPNLGFQLPVTNACNWGTPLNSNMTALDLLLSGNSTLTALKFANGTITGPFTVQTKNQGTNLTLHSTALAINCSTNMACTDDGTTFTITSSGGGGSGTVTTSGSPANGNLTKFSGTTAITNGDLSGDVTTSGTLATTLATTIANAHTFSGNLTATAGQNIVQFYNTDGVLWVDSNKCSNIAACVTLASTNQTLIIIPSTYAGVDCPAATSTKLTFWDLRGGTNICSQNVLSYGTTSGAGLYSMLRGISISTGGVSVAGYFQNEIVNGIGGAGTNSDGGSFEADVSGALSGTFVNVQASENPVSVTSTGGTITSAVGTLGYINTGGGSTTAITTAKGVWGLGCNNIAGSGVITNCYGTYSDEQRAGSTRNYALAGFGPNLLGYGSNAGLSALDAEDSSHVAHRFLVIDSSSNTLIKAIGTNGLFLQDSTGATQAKITSSGFTLPGITGLTQCLQTDSTGLVSGTGSLCGSGGGGTAFSALTASTNSNAGTFAATGNTWDFTAAAHFKLMSVAAFVSTANGELGYNPTSKVWHIWQNAADKNLIVATNLGTAGQMCGSNTDGSCTFSDPVVSGPDAPGAVSTKNPVQVAGNDGTDVRAISTDASGHLNIVFSAAQPVTGTFWQATQPVSGTFWQATQPISAASLPLPTGAATAAKQPALGTAGTASADVITVQGKAGMTPVVVDGSGVTQPVSATSLPLPSGAAADSSLTTLDTDLKADPCGPGHAKSSAFYDAATNGATQLVALSSGKIIYVCSYYVSSSSTTANTVKLVYGTGSNCATGQTAITPGRVLQAGTSTGPAGFTVANSAGLQTIPSNELCVLTNAAQAAQVEVYYVQQ